MTQKASKAFRYSLCNAVQNKVKRHVLFVKYKCDLDLGNHVSLNFHFTIHFK